MKNYEGLAVVEIRYFTYAIEVLDHMCKAANVEFLSSENYLGGRLVTLIVGGSVSEVSNAIEVVKEVCRKKEENPLKMALVITNPHEEIMKYIVPLRKVKSRAKKSEKSHVKSKKQEVKQINQETKVEKQGQEDNPMSEGKTKKESPKKPRKASKKTSKENKK